MKRIILFICIMLTAAAYEGSAEVRVKVRDLTYFDGLKDNQIFGFGLVVGLQGTGDTKSVLTSSSLQNLLKNIGLDTEEQLNSRNVAAVLITAKLPPFVRVGDRIDVTISSIGNAKSLEGGILIQSPLKGANGKVYLVAQGPVTVGTGDKRHKAVKTNGHITNGGIVEEPIVPQFIDKGSVVLVLKNWNFYIANEIIKAINRKFPDSKPALEQGGKISLKLPQKESLPQFLADIEKLEIEPGSMARVVINEKDGTIVMGGDVRISEVLVSKEGLSVKIEGSEKHNTVSHLKEAGTIKELVDSLNFIGAPTRDIISIIKAIKEAGALHAELIIK